ncbi:MAG: hypothetical protein KGZ87_08100 [Bacteroidetes bacterium]|nr:hypothetical protein [Bacteroidota bacterium]
MKYFLILFFVSCSIKNHYNNNYEIIVLKKFTYGKCGLPYDELDYISKLFNINRRYLTSSIYTNDSMEYKSYVINDKTFNYDFFGTNAKEIKFEAKLFVKSYGYKGKKKYIAYKIE